MIGALKSLTIVLAPALLVLAVLVSRQSHAKIERAVDQRHAEIAQRLDSMNAALGALVTAQTDNGSADARLYADVAALVVELRRNAARDRARFSLTTAAMGAVR